MTPSAPASARERDPASVRELFSKISARYDFANHLLSGGIDVFWRSSTAALLANSRPQRVLDLACGSGDLWLAIRKRLPGAEIIGADFCQPLLDIAATKGCAPLLLADALALPFEDARFDAVAIGFGFRNMADYPRAAAECARVLRPGGELHLLDFSMPSAPLFRPLYRFYLHRILPRLAGWVTGQPGAYEYLGESIEQFPCGDAMLRLLKKAGFQSATARPLTLGIATHYTATR